MIHNATSYDIAPLEWLVGKYLPAFKGELTVKTDDALLDKFSTDEVKIDAFLDRNKYAPLYTLYLCTDLDNVEKILCHEFCHLKQMEECRLVVNMKDKTFAFEGKAYSAAYPYKLRPWEVEAFALEDKYRKEWKHRPDRFFHYLKFTPL